MRKPEFKTSWLIPLWAFAFCMLSVCQRNAALLGWLCTHARTQRQDGVCDGSCHGPMKALRVKHTSPTTFTATLHFTCRIFIIPNAKLCPPPSFLHLKHVVAYSRSSLSSPTNRFLFAYPFATHHRGSSSAAVGKENIDPSRCPGILWLHSSMTRPMMRPEIPLSFECSTEGDKVARSTRQPIEQTFLTKLLCYVTEFFSTDFCPVWNTFYKDWGRQNGQFICVDKSIYGNLFQTLEQFLLYSWS